MMTTNALHLIEQLIKRTKNNSLTWTKYSKTDIELKPVYKSPLTLNSLVVSVAATSVLIKEGSYVCSHNNGYFFLLLYRAFASEAEIELRVQTQDSKCSKIYASSTETDSNISAQLKRLYNLVDNAPSQTEIDQFIEDFIMNS